MARLTVPPNFIGTPGLDTLIGEQLNVSLAIGIDILTGDLIYTLSGKDNIKGTGATSIGDLNQGGMELASLTVAV
ncbi:MAG: hypothetical protein V7K40_25230 [Nostoc sp.]|uniref:hypothetical protein n=1 Tax=Nostoc sp. TaxID=1180 RepID=UPI002FF8EAAC